MSERHAVDAEEDRALDAEARREKRMRWAAASRRWYAANRVAVLAKKKAERERLTSGP